MVPTTGSYFHLHMISDSTGETLITVARAVAAQYANVTPVEHVYPLIRSQKQLDRVLPKSRKRRASFCSRCWKRISSGGWKRSAARSTSRACRSSGR